MKKALLIAAALFSAGLLAAEPKEGWQQSGDVALPFPAAVNRIRAACFAGGWRHVRTERLGGPLKPVQVMKFADDGGRLLYFMLWRVDVAKAGYAFRIEETGKGKKNERKR